MTVQRAEAADSSISDQSSLMQLPSQGVGERLTDDSVAHGHRPPDPICNPSCADDVGSHDFRSQQQSASSNAHPFSVDSSSSDGPFLHAPSGVADAQALQCHGGPGSLAVVWFLDGVSKPHNPDHRFTTLTGDPTTWPLQLRSVWNDYFQVDDVISFTMVESLPGGLQEAAHLGFILHRNLEPAQRALLITLYDNGLGDGPPFSFARVLPTLTLQN